MCEFSAGVLRSRGVKQWPLRRMQHVRGSDQCRGVTLEDPAGMPGHPPEQENRWLFALKQLGGLQDPRAQTRITGGRGNPRSYTYPFIR